MNIEAKERVLQINMGQVPKEYKKTKAGIIPQEWKEFKLGSLGNTFSGLNGKTKDDFGLGKPYISYMNIFNNIIINDKKLEYVNIKDNENQNKVKYGDIFFTTSSETAEEVGMSSVYLGDMNELYLNSFCFGFRLKDFKPLNPHFAVYFFRSKVFRCVLNKLAQGATRYNLSKRSMMEEIIFLPSILEQQKIAEILSTCVRGTELKEKLIEQKKLQKKYLMKALLDPKSPNFRRLPGFDKDWEEIKLGECFTERKENNCTLRLLSITSEKGVIDRVEIEHKDNSNEDKSKYKVILKGDIGYNTMRMWQGVSGVSNLTGIVSPAYTVCKPKEEICPEFFGYLFKLQSVINVFHRYSQGLVNDTLSLKYAPFAKLILPIPKYEEQKTIANVLYVVDKEIGLLEKEFEQQKLKKKALMQLLLTGKVRVNVL